MLIPSIKEKLLKHPQVTYTATESHLEIPAQTPSGFKVWIQEYPNHCTVGFEGWHEEFTNPTEALECFALGLSTGCKLRVFRCRGSDYKWQLLHQVDGQWVVDSETGLFVFTFWQRVEQRELQNNIISKETSQKP